MVDDDKDMCAMAEAALGGRSYAVTSTGDPDEALRLITQPEYKVMLADIQMDSMNGIELCRAALAKRPDLLVVVMTGFGSMDVAVQALRAGAFDFVTKPISNDVLMLILERAVRHGLMVDELSDLRRRVEERRLPSVAGNSREMRRVADLVSRVASSDTSVLITGESGTGKEVIARQLHEKSGRKGPFLAINCAAVPETLLESELFGHVKGAFTDARAPRAGLFVEANKGTLFLDEIGDMPLGMQAKLLRVLQERKVRPVGGSEEIPFDARILAATNHDLEKAVQARAFREDLFYRINVVRIDMPPLRARREDILPLAQHFLMVAAQRSHKPVRGFGQPVAELLLNYEWPGNIRELENCIERAVALAQFDELTVDDLPSKLRGHREREVFSTSHDPNELPPMHLVEERYLQKVLTAVRGNKTLAAKVLGFDRRTLYRKLERLKGGGHDESDFEADSAPDAAMSHASPPPPGE